MDTAVKSSGPYASLLVQLGEGSHHVARSEVGFDFEQLTWVSLMLNCWKLKEFSPHLPMLADSLTIPRIMRVGIWAVFGRAKV